MFRFTTVSDPGAPLLLSSERRTSLSVSRSVANESHEPNGGTVAQSRKRPRRVGLWVTLPLSMCHLSAAILAIVYSDQARARVVYSGRAAVAPLDAG